MRPYSLVWTKNSFTTNVRPYLTEIPIGARSIAFDCLAIEAFADYYKECPRAFSDEQSRRAQGTEQGGSTAGPCTRSTAHVWSSTSGCKRQLRGSSGFAGTSVTEDHESLHYKEDITNEKH